MHLFCKWLKVRDTGKHIYEECQICGERRVLEKFPGGYQPVDREWLSGAGRREA